MADINGLLSDPQFMQLDPASQKQVLGRIDPAFSGLSDGELAQFKSRVGRQASQPAPTFGSELYSNVVSPVLDAGADIFNAIQHPLESIQSIPGRVAGIVAPQMQQGREAYNALTGRGSYQGYNPFERASEAVGHGLAAALPVVGPMAARAGENFGSGNVGAGIADVVPLAAPLAVEGAAALPRLSRAAASLDAVSSAVGDVPLDLSTLDKTAASASRALRGATVPKPIDAYNDLRNAGEGLTFNEARDLYSNSTSQTMWDKYANMTGPMRKQLAKFTSDLHDAIAEAADTKGLGDQYRDALAEYRHAKQLYTGAKAAVGVAVAPYVPSVVKKFWNLIP